MDNRHFGYVTKLTEFLFIFVRGRFMDTQQISCHKCKMGAIAKNMQTNEVRIFPRSRRAPRGVVIIIDGRPRRPTENRDATDNSHGSQAKKCNK
jgi:hypothetical protein